MKRKQKRAKPDEPEANFNPAKRVYWTEGEPGRKSGSKVPPAVRKARRRRKP
jgi:hypothetical protein